MKPSDRPCALALHPATQISKTLRHTYALTFATVRTNQQNKNKRTQPARPCPSVHTAQPSIHPFVHPFGHEPTIGKSEGISRALNRNPGPNSDGKELRQAPTDAYTHSFALAFTFTAHLSDWELVLGFALRYFSSADASPSLGNFHWF
jgi:hypothetical protein